MIPRFSFPPVLRFLFVDSLACSLVWQMNLMKRDFHVKWFSRVSLIYSKFNPQFTMNTSRTHTRSKTRWNILKLPRQICEKHGKHFSLVFVLFYPHRLPLPPSNDMKNLNNVFLMLPTHIFVLMLLGFVEYSYEQFYQKSDIS